MSTRSCVTPWPGRVAGGASIVSTSCVMAGGYSSAFNQATILRLVFPHLNKYPPGVGGKKRGGMTDDFEERLGLKIAAYHDAALLHAAIALGLPEKMEKRGSSADALAAELGLSAPHLHRLLR